MATKESKKKRLVIVESPAKARTLTGILGKEYKILPSVGHVRDLPKSKLGVDTERDFAPEYEVPEDKLKIVEEIKEAASKASEVFLATDPDREGEAISWHLLEASNLRKFPIQRVVFHEITPEAVKEAFEHPREIDYDLVDAQQARRVLDRLVGYQVSPILWQKIRYGLSAGRVQSVAVRMVVEREREIQAFKPIEYWTIDVDLVAAAGDGSEAFIARLVGPVSAKKKIEIPNQRESDRLVGLLKDSPLTVADIKKRPQSRKPAAPFTTSTLQQDASRRFSFTAKRTMAVAQQLYEGLKLPAEGQVGLITYMRTDSTNIAESATREAREYIAGKFGKEYVPEKARAYKTKGKRAQEAHEAIRATSAMREPESLEGALTKDQLRLYTLIWQRFVACQMADAEYDRTTVEVHSQPADGSEALLLRATESVLKFAGFQRIYEEQRDEDAPEEDPEARGLPQIGKGDALRAAGVKPEQHFTEPPPRYTEASLVKALEANGIGRPSTYAPTLSTIQERGYVKREERTLVPQELGIVVNDLLVEHFPNIFSLGFTAEMEEELDEVARGERPWAPVVRQFYDPLQVAMEAAAAAPKVEQLTEEVCEKCGKAMVKKWGRFGQFLACTGYPECKSTRPIEGEEEEQQTDEKCGECDSPMSVKRGRFGKFLACTRYPECKGTKPLLIKVGVPCPDCGSDIVEKRTKKKRTFYGCATYPDCEFTSWSRPLQLPCPQCEGMLVSAGKARVEGETPAKCTQCEFKGAIKSAEAFPELAEASA